MLARRTILGPDFLIETPPAPLFQRRREREPARLGKELENLGTLQAQSKSKTGPVTPQPILPRGLMEPLPRLCEPTLTIRLQIPNLSYVR